MTAEIAILNKEAVALAADSAVSAHIGNGNKIFTSANKLFALSYQHPVGIMVYNNAHFMEVPWETIIKTFRSTIPKKGFDKLEDYTNYFLSFLSHCDAVLPSDVEARYLVNFISGNFIQIRKDLETRVTTIFRDKGKIDDATTNNVLSELIDTQKTLWEKADGTADGCAVVEVGTNAVNQYKKEIEGLINSIFINLHLSEELKNALFVIGANIICKGYNGTSNSGIVIAGFGEKEYFPSIHAFSVEGKVHDILRRNAIFKATVSSTQPGLIIPFAQREMVDRFMEGVDPAYKSIVNGYVSELCKEYAKKVVENVDGIPTAKKDNLREALIKVGENLAKDFERKISQAAVNQFILPVYSVISLLPKNELAIMAESLVSITSLKRQFSAQEETVKGPIDVAVISKWDGFIWIKRKHYFQSEFNPQFEKKYEN